MSIADRPVVNVSAISAELQTLQRHRVYHLKSRIMVANRLQATVAGTIGYHSGMKEAERRKVFAEARALIKQIEAGEVASAIHGIVATTMIAVNGFDEMVKALEKEMTIQAKRLSVAAWVQEPDQKGFGLLSLAIVVGECGDLANYANPAKVWRRMACAPFTKDGETLMGATWRSRSKSRTETKLEAADWEEFGYSPRRRSIAYLIGEGLMKQNGGAGETSAETEATGAGPYRSRYDQAKAKAASRDDWTRCSKCNGMGRVKKAKCANCKGSRKVMLRCHRHGMLLAAKLLLKNLWLEWNGQPDGGWK